MNTYSKYFLSGLFLLAAVVCFQEFRLRTLENLLIHPVLKESSQQMSRSETSDQYAKSQNVLTGLVTSAAPGVFSLDTYVADLKVYAKKGFQGSIPFVLKKFEIVYDDTTQIDGIVDRNILVNMSVQVETKEAYLEGDMEKEPIIVHAKTIDVTVPASAPDSTKIPPITTGSSVKK